MDNMAKDGNGVWRELQSRLPVLRPEGAEPDCMYCSGKSSCPRKFFVGDRNDPCSYYEELNERVKKEERTKELKEVFDPVPRPEGASPDCLHCQRLKEKLGAVCRDGICGPWQGQGKVCGNYHEISARPDDKPQNCIYCLENQNCSQARVVRDGRPCERYREYTGVTQKTA